MTDEEAVEAAVLKHVVETITPALDPVNDMGLKPFNGKQVVVPIINRACSACGYSVKEQADLTCHKGPPQLSFIALPTMQPGPLGGRPQQGLAIQNYSGWPIVRPEQWCGEFTQKGRN